MNKRDLTGLSFMLVSQIGFDEEHRFLWKTPPIWADLQRVGEVPLEAVCLLDTKDKVLFLLQQQYGSSDEMNLRQNMEDLLSGSSYRNSFEARKRYFRSTTLAEREKDLSRYKRNSIPFVDRNLVVMQYGESLPVGGIAAMDIADYVSLAMAGRVLDYWDEEEFCKLLLVALTAARNLYDGFAAFGLAAMVGLIYKADAGEYPSYYNHLRGLLRHPDGYWRRLNWNE